MPEPSRSLYLRCQAAIAIVIGLAAALNHEYWAAGLASIIASVLGYLSARPRLLKAGPTRLATMKRHSRMWSAVMFVVVGVMAFAILYESTGRYPALWAIIGIAAGLYSALVMRGELTS